MADFIASNGIYDRWAEDDWFKTLVGACGRAVAVVSSIIARQLCCALCPCAANIITTSLPRRLADNNKANAVAFVHVRGGVLVVGAAVVGATSPPCAVQRTHPV
jgi:hypothetical protein